MATSSDSLPLHSSSSSSSSPPISSAHEDEFRGRPLNSYFSVVIQVVGLLVLVVGLLGNNLLLLVLFKWRQGKRSRNAFIWNLALADVVALCFSLPCFLLDLQSDGHPVVSRTHCTVNGVVLGVSYTVSILSLLMISFYRYLKVCRRSLFNTLFNAFRNRAACLALWVLASVLNLPVLVDFGYDPRSHLCNARAGRTQPDYGSVGLVCLLLLPLLLVAFFNLAIFRRWAGSHLRLKTTRKRQKVAKPTWKSFLSMSLNNIAAMEESDSKRDSSSVDTPRNDRLSSSDCFSEFTSTTVGASALDCTRQARNQVVERQKTVPAFTCSGDTSNGSERVLNSARPSVVPRLAHCMTDSSTDVRVKRASVIVDASNIDSNFSVYRNMVSLNLQARMRRASLLCKALDLDIPFLTGEGPATSKCKSSRKKCYPDLGRGRPSNPGLACPVSLSPDVDNQFPMCQISFTADTSDNDDFVQLTDRREEESALDSETLDWNDCEEADGISEPVRFNSTRVDRGLGLNKKSLYPSIDRTAKFFPRPRKSMHYMKKPPRSGLSLVRSLLVIYVCIFVLYTPWVLTVVLTFFLQDAVPAELSVTSTILLFVNCAVNWVVYGVMNTTCRQAYISTLKSWAQCCCYPFRRRTSSSVSMGPVTHHGNH